jgi:archaellum biogenesis ATPase FlaH
METNTPKFIDPETLVKGLNHGKEFSLNGSKWTGIFTGNELLSRKIESIPTLVDPLFPAVGLVAVAGSSDTGKSSFLRQLAIHVVLGLPTFLGFNLNIKHQRAIYVSTEDDDNAYSFLMNKANLKYKRANESYSGLTVITDTSNLLEKLDTKLSESDHDLVEIDAFTDLYGKSMNDSNQVRTFLNEYSQLAQKHQCLIIFLHHTGKRTEDLAPSKHNLLGSQGFEAKMRMVAEIRTDPSDPSKRHLCIVKGNYLSKEYKTESYVLIFDDNLLFNDTGDRKPFDELKSTNKTDSIIEVKTLQSQGLTQIEIAEKTGLSQPTVSRYLKS